MSFIRVNLDEAWQAFVDSATRYGAADALGITAMELDARLNMYMEQKGLIGTPDEHRAAERAGTPAQVADAAVVEEPGAAWSRAPVSDEDLAKAWHAYLEADTLGQAARQLGMGNGAADGRVRAYMKRHNLEGTPSEQRARHQRDVRAAQAPPNLARLKPELLVKPPKAKPAPAPKAGSNGHGPEETAADETAEKHWKDQWASRYIDLLFEKAAQLPGDSALLDRIERLLGLAA